MDQPKYIAVALAAPQARSEVIPDMVGVPPAVETLVPVQGVVRAGPVGSEIRLHRLAGEELRVGPRAGVRLAGLRIEDRTGIEVQGADLDAVLLEEFGADIGVGCLDKRREGALDEQGVGWDLWFLHSLVLSSTGFDL